MVDIPQPAIVCGWIIVGLGMFIVPFHFLLSLTADEEGSFTERIIATVKSGKAKTRALELFRPNSAWGPTGVDDRLEWKSYKEKVGVDEWDKKIFKKFETR